ncbi:MAG: hypothetical protein LBI15_01440 [Dysgonamonadaceae bacterium]|jgi:hypothetical protein|nr:hypothetical protein [Dysgonamonadaceae bacterium]
MEEISMQVAKMQIFNQFWLSIFLLVPLVLVARTAVAGTRYSPILLIVVFGLAMGLIMVLSGVSTPGLPEFQMIDILSKTTIIPLIASFFVGGQELRKVFNKIKLDPDEFVLPSDEEVCVGTNRTQLVYIARTFFLLVGIETAYKLLLGAEGTSLTKYYPLYAYIGLVCAIILIDYKAKFKNKRLYIQKGVLEMSIIILVLMLTFHIAEWIRPIIALPQIFFAMLVTCTLGAFFYKWSFGPTIKSLLFAGLPIVLAGNFIIGGSRMTEAFSISGMNSVLAFGFFGQILWMFGGIALLMLFAKTANVRNLAPGLAGGLSHAGLTGACTAGDLGKAAAVRAPIMINVPFTAHIFVFSILAVSAERGHLTMIPALIVLVAGILLTAWSLRTLKNAKGNDNKEITGLMKFSLGWQLAAIFGSFVLLSLFGMPLNNVAVSATSSLSHFGLFAATQGGMFGAEVAELLPFIFAMPFLVHPFVFFLFGRAMDKGGEMPKLPVYILVGAGIAGIVYALFLI